MFLSVGQNLPRAIPSSSQRPAHSSSDDSEECCTAARWINKPVGLESDPGSPKIIDETIRDPRRGEIHRKIDAAGLWNETRISGAEPVSGFEKRQPFEQFNPAIDLGEFGHRSRRWEGGSIDLRKRASAPHAKRRTDDQRRRQSVRSRSSLETPHSPNEL
jgi:hypothetical protein